MIAHNRRPKLWRTILLLTVIFITIFGLYKLGQKQEKRNKAETNLVVEHPEPKDKVNGEAREGDLGQVNLPVAVQGLALSLIIIPTTCLAWRRRHTLRRFKGR